MNSFSWILSLISPLIAFVLGARSSLWLQERADAERRRNAAAALREDIRRMQRYLMNRVGRAGTLDAFDVRISWVAPAIHPWVQSVIIQLADADPQIVARFMQLEDELAEWQGALGRYLSPALALEHAENELAANERLALRSNDPNHDVYTAQVRTWIAEVERLRPQKDREAPAFIEADLRLRTLLGELGDRLSRQVEHPLPQLIPVPEDDVASSPGTRSTRVDLHT